MVTDALSPATRTAVAPIVIGASSAAFLFVGFFKGAIPLPFDLTIAAAIVAAGSLLAVRDEAWRVIDPITAILCALGLWLAMRYIADPNSWGLRKLGEFYVFGGLAFLLGATVMSSPAGRSTFINIAAWGGLPISIVVIATAALGNPYSFSWFLSGGYQLTGLFLGASCIAAATIKRPVLFGFNALGCAVTGHVTGAAFGVVAVLAVWAMHRDWRASAHQVGAAAIAVTVYSALVAPPLVFMRLLWKLGSVTLVWLHLPVTPEEAAAGLSTSKVGSGLLSVLRAMPAESQQYLVEYGGADRIHQYQFAIDQFMARPWLGNGVGMLDYLGSRYPHNQILELAAEAGFLPAALFVAAMVLSLWSCVRSRQAFALGFCAMIFLGAMVGGYFGGRHLLFAFGLAVGARHARV